MKWLFLVMFLAGCAPPEEEQRQDIEIQKLLLEDKQNKELELFYLNEIRIAQENDDWDAYKYYFQEYIEVPRLDIPDHLRQHPDYFIGGEGVKY